MVQGRASNLLRVLAPPPALLVPRIETDIERGGNYLLKQKGGEKSLKYLDILFNKIYQHFLKEDSQKGTI